MISVMRRRQEDEDASPYAFCEGCQQMFERPLILECPYCSKAFCRDCEIRSGNLTFCSRNCARGWFFADDDAGEEEY